MQRTIVGRVFAYPIRPLLIELIVVTVLTIGVGVCSWRVSLTGGADFTLPWIMLIVLVHIVYPGVGILMTITGILVLWELIWVLKADPNARRRFEGRVSILRYLAPTALAFAYAFLQVYSIYYLGLLFVTLISCAYILASVEVTHELLLRAWGILLLTTLVACLPMLWFR